MVSEGEIKIDYKAGRNGTNRYWITMDPEPQFTVNRKTLHPEPQFRETLNPAPPEPSVNHQEPPIARVRDPLFDAIAEACRVDPITAGASIGKVKAALLKANPPYTAEDVSAFGKDWWSWSGRTEPPSLWKLKEQIGKTRYSTRPNEKTTIFKDYS